MSKEPLPWDDFKPSDKRTKIGSINTLKKKEEPVEPVKSNIVEQKQSVPSDILQRTMYPRPDWSNPRPSDDNVLFLNQSLAKEIIDLWGNEVENCPRMINELYIAKNFEAEPTLSQLKGSYFETLCIGSGTNGKVIDDLPRVKQKGKNFGTKTKDQLRIDQQVIHFNQLCLQNGIQIIPGFHTQVRIIKHYKKNVYLIGDVDTAGLQFMYKDNPFVGSIDIKLTQNVYSDFGPYGWGDLSKIDMIQADMYHNLVMDIDFELNDKYNPKNHLRQLFTPILQQVFNNGEGRFMFWVFGYKFLDGENEYLHQFKDPERLRTNERTADLQNRLDHTISIIKEMKGNGYPAKPNYDLCKKCPVNHLNGGYCKEADTQEVC